MYTCTCIESFENSRGKVRVSRRSRIRVRTLWPECLRGRGSRAEDSLLWTCSSGLLPSGVDLGGCCSEATSELSSGPELEPGKDSFKHTISYNMYVRQNVNKKNKSIKYMCKNGFQDLNTICKAFPLKSLQLHNTSYANASMQVQVNIHVWQCAERDETFLHHP